jgi:hypothetical protein
LNLTSLSINEQIDAFVRYKETNDAAAYIVDKMVETVL